ncbi:MAG: hypothetical protein JNM84_22850 [Planctomycetes bacterium]|nr:hypothetical protein [Planctomycetota bacterium]
MTQFYTVSISSSVGTFVDYPTGFGYYGVENASAGYLATLSSLLDDLEDFTIEGESYAEQQQAIQVHLSEVLGDYNLLVNSSSTNGKIWTSVGEDVAYVHPLNSAEDDVLVEPNGTGSKQLVCECTITPQESFSATFDVDVPEDARRRLAAGEAADLVIGFGLGRTEVVDLEVEGTGAAASAVELIPGHGDARLASLTARSGGAPRSVRVRATYRGDSPSSIYALPIARDASANTAADSVLSAQRAQREEKLRILESRLRAIHASPREADQRRCLRWDALTSPTFIQLFLGAQLDAELSPAVRALVGDQPLPPATLPALRALYPALESSLQMRAADFWKKRATRHPSEADLTHVPLVAALVLRSFDLEGAHEHAHRRLRSFRVWLSRFTNRELAIEVHDSNDGSLNAEPEGSAFALLAEFCALASHTWNQGQRTLDPLWNELYAASLTALEVFFLRYAPRLGRRVPSAYERTARRWAENPPLTRDQLEQIAERYERTDGESLPQHHARLQRAHGELVWLAFRDAAFARPSDVARNGRKAKGGAQASKNTLKPQPKRAGATAPAKEATEAKKSSKKRAPR